MNDPQPAASDPNPTHTFSLCGLTLARSNSPLVKSFWKNCCVFSIVPRCTPTLHTRFPRPSPHPPSWGFLCAVNVAQLFEQGKYQEAVTLLNRLLRELKRMDDKQLLVETHLVEARVHNALRNTPKAKAALTAARTAGNSIYIAPIMQVRLNQGEGGGVECAGRRERCALRQQWYP